MSELTMGVESAAPPALPRPPSAAAKSERLLSLDAYRGFIMLVLVSGGFGIKAIADALQNAKSPSAALWERLSFQVGHPEWLSQFHNIGCAFWDLIQPSFMFMVGVAMVYSYANRQARGEPDWKMNLHAVIRAVVLVLLGVFLSSQGKTQTSFVFANVLAQIGLAYLFVFVLLHWRVSIQLAAAVLILVGYWGLFVFWPGPAPAPPVAVAEQAVAANQAEKPAAPAKKGAAKKAQEAPKRPEEIVPTAQQMLDAKNEAGWVQERFFSRFSKLANPAMRFDGWFLQLFPREGDYVPNEGGYTTLNFVPSIVTILLGALVGQLLQGRRRPIMKFLFLVGGAVLCMALGAAAGLTVCPVIKRIWTPSWVLYSTAYTLAFLAGFYLLVDVLRLRFLGWPLAVVGMNSMAVYLMGQLTKSWIAGNLKTTFGQDIFSGTYGPMVQSFSVMAVIWLLCWWMYRQKIFVRI